MALHWQAMELDVLVFAEIGMDPVNYLLAFSRLAPVQVATHGERCILCQWLGS